MNFTLPLPPGSTNHGDPRLICLPPRWYDYILFYLGNYVAHAATTRLIPGQSWWEAVFRTGLVLFLPMWGMLEGFADIMPLAGLKLRKQPLELAATCGALCTVVKIDTQDHKVADPSGAERGEGVFRSGSEAPGSATEDQDRNESWWPGGRTPSVVMRKIQGIIILPPEYDIVSVPKCFALKPHCERPESMAQDEWEKKTAALELPNNYNIPKAVIGLIQTTFAITTIYRARGDQIEQYGYAAFGLTVVPYALMSIANFVASLATPEYPCMFLVSSPDLVNAIQDGGHFDCIVGEIDLSSQDKQDIPRQLRRNDSGFGFRQMHRQLRPSLGDWRSSSVFGKIKKCLLLLLFYPGLALLFLFPISVWVAFFFSPVFIAGAMSGFQGNNSTTAQRAWILAWLVGNGVLPLATTRIHLELVKRSKRGDMYTLILMCASCIPPIGGMVVVGQMLRDFGICIRVR